MNRMEKLVEEAILLRDRFPDLSDQDVLEHVADVVAEETTPAHPASPIGIIVLMAYESGSVKATSRFCETIGFGPLEMEQPDPGERARDTFEHAGGMTQEAAERLLELIDQAVDPDLGSMFDSSTTLESFVEEIAMQMEPTTDKADRYRANIQHNLC
jgi:hypothetical protein